ncbi:MAG: hypothetical protein ACRDZR_00350 [Acidimicrobiales bacterium]
MEPPLVVARAAAALLAAAVVGDDAPTASQRLTLTQEICVTLMPKPPGMVEVTVQVAPPFADTAALTLADVVE